MEWKIKNILLKGQILIMKYSKRVSFENMYFNTINLRSLIVL